MTDDEKLRSILKNKYVHELIFNEFQRYCQLREMYDSVHHLPIDWCSEYNRLNLKYDEWYNKLCMIKNEIGD